LLARRADPQRGRTSLEDLTEIFVGIDVAKRCNAVAGADAGRAGEVRLLCKVNAKVGSMRRVVKKVTAESARAHLCCEVGLTGYHLPVAMIEPCWELPHDDFGVRHGIDPA
jgi:hypothetical protein